MNEIQFLSSKSFGLVRERDPYTRNYSYGVLEVIVRVLSEHCHFSQNWEVRGPGKDTLKLLLKVKCIGFQSTLCFELFRPRASLFYNFIWEVL